jgi:hypothetical protein
MLTRLYAPAYFAALDARAESERAATAVTTGREAARQVAAAVAHNEAFAARCKALWPIDPEKLP